MRVCVAAYTCGEGAAEGEARGRDQTRNDRSTQTEASSGSRCKLTESHVSKLKYAEDVNQQDVGCASKAFGQCDHLHQSRWIRLEMMGRGDHDPRASDSAELEGDR